MSEPSHGAASTPPKKPQRPVPPLRVSPTITKLLATLRAEIEAEEKARRLAQLHETADIVVLPPIDRTRARFVDEGSRLSFVDGDGARLDMWRRHKCPASWEKYPNRLGWHPSHWDLDMTRVDGNGVRWSTDLGWHVTDDFGNLVKVPQ